MPSKHHTHPLPSPRMDTSEREGPPPRVESENTLCPSGPTSPFDEKKSMGFDTPKAGFNEDDEHKYDEEDPVHHAGPSRPPSPLHRLNSLTPQSTRTHTSPAPSSHQPSDSPHPSQVDLELGPRGVPPPRTAHFLDDKSAFFKVCFISTACATQLIVQGQLGTVMIPLHYVGRHMGTEDNGELSWMTASYGLTVGMFLVMAGRLGDLYGPKLVWMMGCGIMIATNIGSGFCKSAIPFDITRALAGVGSAFALPNALAILGRTYPPGRTRNFVFSILGALAPAGWCIGGAVAAVFAQLVSVGWIWWFVALFTFAFVIVGIFVLPPDTPHPNPSSRSFDSIGAILLATSLGLFNFVFNQAALVGWETPYIYILLIVSLFAFVAFYFWERHVGRKALIPMEVLKRESLLVYLSLWLGWMSFGTFLLYTTLFIHDIREKHLPLVMAAQTVPFAAGGMTAALLVPFLIRHVRGHWIFLAAMLAFTIANILGATAPVDGIYWGNTFFSMLIGVFGPDLSFATGQLIVSNSVDHDFQGIAAGIVSMITNYSQSIGLGLTGTVERYIRGPGTSPSELLHGYRTAFWFATGLAGLATIVVGGFVRMPAQEWREDGEGEGRGEKNAEGGH
ncbi:hypothetical protein IAT38_006289 [Cryptococcus sp. DSM 104549]